MKVKLHPRFFIIILCLFVGIVLFGSNVFLKKRVEVKLVDQDKGNVLAAQDTATSKNSYDLIEKDSGQVVNTTGSSIESYQPVIISYTVKEGDTLYSIAETYHADPQTIVDFPNNNLTQDLQLRVGQILIIPNGYINDSQKPTLPPIAHGTGEFSWPIDVSYEKPVVTQYAYYWHAGSIDIAIPMNTNILATDDGTVKAVEHLTTSYGVHVIIDHGNGLTSLYAHLSETNLQVGQGIQKGDLVGLSGSTGHSTGPHLHLEVRRNGVPVDPMTLLPPQ